MSIQLDEHQLKAVKHFEGPALVVAGPGSGKTTVIIERILHLIRKHNVDPESILAIAFTNSAADEMRNRINDRLFDNKKPKICTLHAFGKDLITDHPIEAGYNEAPNNVWNANQIGEIIKQEKRRLNTETISTPVAIYKMEGVRTGRCYIGQTTNPERREQEHRTNSSNRRLREALQEGDEKFKFEVIGTSQGIDADSEEKTEIDNHRMRAADILEMVPEEKGNEHQEISITIYKIRSSSTITSYFGMSTDLEKSKELHFTESTNESFRIAIEEDNIDLSSFEVVSEESSWEDGERRLHREVSTYRKWAVFNEEDPLHARDSTRRRIEVFCEYFDVPYHEVLEHSQQFKHEMRSFDEMKEDIEKEKRKVNTGVFQPQEIADPILRAFAIKYEKRKTEAKAIDFHDMLIFSANMLEKKENEVLLHEYRQRFQYVFVDEFQDISPADFRLIKLFPDNLFAVGDDDQAIYGFRGGDSKIMQRDFPDWKNITEYKITNNYRSNSDIVIHSKALIEKNRDRKHKDLRSYNSKQDKINVLSLTNQNLKVFLLKEILTTIESNYKKVSILARNWLGEINKIQSLLDCDELRMEGFDIEWEESEEPQDDADDEDERKRRKLFLRKNSKVIEVMNIFAAKGREWDKVILPVNIYYDSLPRPQPENDITEERRIFYVAVTRAKHELVILDGGNCEFVSEFQELPNSERKKRLGFYNTSLLSAFGKRIINAKHQLKEVSEFLSTTFASQRVKLIDASTKDLRKQYETELEILRGDLTKVEKTRMNLEAAFPLQLNASRETFLKKLIPEMNHLELIVDKTTEKSNSSAELVTLSKKLHTSQKQFLDFLKIHGIRPIETVAKTFNSDLHEVCQPAMYSDEVPVGRIVKEFQRGYLLHNQVIQKAKVIISKGSNPWTLEKLAQTVEVYLDRLFSAFQVRYNLTDIEKPLVIQKLVEYLSGLEDNCIEEICSFVNKSSKEAIQERRYTDYCAGLKKIHLCTDVFQKFWSKIWEIIRFLSAKNRNRADLILSQEYVQPVRFVTYKGYYDLTTVETYPNCIKGFDEQRLERTIEKRDILFAFPTMNMKVLKPFIKRDLSIVDQRLQPIERISEGVPVPDDNLKSYIQLVTRSGHVMNGYLLESDINYLYMNINDTIVVVYQDGILQFKNIDWDEIANAYEKGSPILGLISGRTKGGFYVKFGSLYGFLPDSESELREVKNIESHVGKTYEMKIFEFNSEQNNLILSQRSWLEEKRSEFFENVEVGQKVKGIVKNIKDFGVFVDLGVIDGLIRKTELSWKRINNTSEVISIGDDVEVMVIQIDRDAEKIALSLKRMTQDPWEDVDKKYPIGSTVQGTINRIEEYGVFLQLEEGVVGLLHISEMQYSNDSKYSIDLLNVGDVVEVTVLKVSIESKHISFSMKQTHAHLLEQLLQKYPDSNK